MSLCPPYIPLGGKKSDVSESINVETCYLIPDEKIFNIKAIRTHTSYKVSIKLLVCQNKKGHSKNYCDIFSDPNAKSRICVSNKTDYVYFHVDKPEQEKSENPLKNSSSTYLLAFTKTIATDTIKKISNEIKKTAKWLDIDTNFIECYIFYYQPRSLPCNTRDWASIKNKFDDSCCNKNYSFILGSIKDHHEWMFITGGYPKFRVEIKE